MSSLSSNVLHHIQNYNSSCIYLIAACPSSSLKIDWHIIHHSFLWTYDNFNYYNLISSQVYRWWYSFGWPCHVKYMCNVYKWYKSHTILLLSSHRVHLLIIPSGYANEFFNICFCIILNAYFLTDYLTAIYSIIVLLFTLLGYENIKQPNS